MLCLGFLVCNSSMSPLVFSWDKSILKRCNIPLKHIHYFTLKAADLKEVPQWSGTLNLFSSPAYIKAISPWGKRNTHNCSGEKVWMIERICFFHMSPSQFQQSFCTIVTNYWWPPIPWAMMPFMATVVAWGNNFLNPALCGTVPQGTYASLHWWSTSCFSQAFIPLCARISTLLVEWT